MPQKYAKTCPIYAQGMLKICQRQIQDMQANLKQYQALFDKISKNIDSATLQHGSESASKNKFCCGFGSSWLGKPSNNSCRVSQKSELYPIKH